MTSEPSYQFKLDDGPWTGAGAEMSTALHGIDDGMHTIAVKVIDQTGREATTWRTFRVDATAPSVMNISPTGENNPANSVIEVLFSEEMDRSSVVVQVQGVRGDITWDGNRMIFRPDEALEYGTVYEITVSGSDVLGNEMDGYSHVFSTYPIVIDDVVEEPEEEGSSIVPIMIAVGIISLIMGVGATIVVMRRRSFTVHEE